MGKLSHHSNPAPSWWLLWGLLYIASLRCPIWQWVPNIPTWVITTYAPDVPKASFGFFVGLLLVFPSKWWDSKFLEAVTAASTETIVLVQAYTVLRYACILRYRSSGLWRRVGSWIDTNISEKNTFFVFRPKHEDIAFLLNGVATQNNIVILAALRTSNLTYFCCSYSMVDLIMNISM